MKYSTETCSLQSFTLPGNVCEFYEGIFLGIKKWMLFWPLHIGWVFFTFTTHRSCNTDLSYMLPKLHDIVFQIHAIKLSLVFWAIGLLMAVCVWMTVLLADGYRTQWARGRRISKCIPSLRRSSMVLLYAQQASSCFSIEIGQQYCFTCKNNSLVATEIAVRLPMYTHFCRALTHWKNPRWAIT